ncbi:Tripartite motif-containing protein 64 [Holothuria leucospilota]|uniref:Tripartite motif-containing protein 64 n=1 Tax=Holothuria leucospilota TaxID=206669 RepID=A0A9Q1BSM4_HOLLE|nr:Tripartite motif-containing protein 64 [Holothuria leucospilota]
MAAGDSPVLQISSDAITCSICFDTFTNPKTLTCGHSLCLDPCLKRLSRQNLMQCPLCRMDIELPQSRNVEDLPTNYVVKHLLETAKSEERKESCSTDDGVSWFISDSGNVCRDHEQNCDFFCKSCMAVVCAKCLLSTHKVGHHDIMAAAEFARQKIDSLLKTLSNIDKLDLGKFEDRRTSMKILQQLGKYYQKMQDFRKNLKGLIEKKDEIRKLCGALVEDLCSNNFERIQEVQGITRLEVSINKEYMRLCELYASIGEDVNRLKKIGIGAAVVVGFSLGIPFLPL